MDASTRLYARLGEIPEDPNDPESLAELLVCAFGAFERYYVCWKTQSGEYRQDGYDLPPALKDWLYPSDGTTRDFASLQVVFGRVEEYFASDKDGKLEYKEPEPVKPIESDPKFEKTPLRRVRTVSFLRPLSDVTARSESPDENKRSSSTSSRRTSRPPSLSYSRTNSDASLNVYQIEEKGYKRSSLRKEEALAVSPTRTNDPTIMHLNMTTATELEAAMMEQADISASRFQVPAGYKLVPIDESPAGLADCNCACHKTSSPSRTSHIYTTSSVQTEAIEFSTSSTPLLQVAAPQISTAKETTVVDDRASPGFEDYFHENPIFIGRSVTSFFSSPGYQLGDSLSSGYSNYREAVYEYEEEHEDD